MSRVRPSARTELDRARALLYRRMVRIRGATLLVLPILAAVMSYYRPWSLEALFTVGIASLLLIVHVWDRMTTEQRGFELRRFAALSLSMTLLIWIVVAATGGLQSPLLIPQPAAVAVLAVLLGPRLAALQAFGMLVPFAWAFAGLHVFADWRPLPSLLGTSSVNDAYFVTVAVIFSAFVGIAYAVGLGAWHAVERSMAAMSDERDQQLTMHAEHSRALTTMAAEIAHELKNPLASIKGLADLMKLEVEGKTSERVDVLRVEVGRLERVLEEFLTFSRPLVPLDLDEVSLEDVAWDVAALFEGYLEHAKLELVVRAESPSVTRCDRRKVRQILINLVRNAAEASKPGDSIVLSVRSEGAERVVEVLDDGDGLSTDVAERLFEPGVTSKSDGSGLGLVVSRAMAREHGGELTLCDRHEGRGCRATLTLPPEVPEEHA